MFLLRKSILAVLIRFYGLNEDAQMIEPIEDNDPILYLIVNVLFRRPYFECFAMYYDTSYLSMLIICQHMLLVKTFDVTALAQ